MLFRSIKKEEIDLTQFVNEIRELMEPSMLNKNLSFHVKRDMSLRFIFSDSIKLKRVLVNLLSNAVKFTHEGEITLAIKWLDLTTHTQIEMQVIDTGIGIPEDKLDKVFDRFYRVDSSYRTKYLGNGLGLSLVKESLEQLGGSIKVTSQEGKGSCFSLEFVFPIFHGTIDKKSDSEIEHPRQPLGLEIKGAVLVAEDNALVLYAVKNILTKLGYEVTAVTEGKAVLNALQTQSFILALLDIGLPDLDGTEIVRRYRQWEQEIGRAHV